MDKLNKIIARCKCGFYLTINSHRDDYETVEQSRPIGFYNIYHYDLDMAFDEILKILNLI